MAFNILLLEQDESALQAMQEAFHDCAGVTVQPGDLLESESELLICPVDGTLLMDSGLAFSVYEKYSKQLDPFIQEWEARLGLPIPVGSHLSQD